MFLPLSIPKAIGMIYQDVVCTLLTEKSRKFMLSWPGVKTAAISWSLTPSPPDLWLMPRRFIISPLAFTLTLTHACFVLLCFPLHRIRSVKKKTSFSVEMFADFACLEKKGRGLKKWGQHLGLGMELKSHWVGTEWKWELTGCQDEWIGEARVGVKGVEIVCEFCGRKLLNSNSVCNSEAAEMLERRVIY